MTNKTNGTGKSELTLNIIEKMKQPQYKDLTFKSEKEFNLSKKITQDGEFNEIIFKEDVKKFIKIIRNELKNPKLNRFSIDKILNFYAGDKLK